MCRLVNSAPAMALIRSYRCCYIGGGMGSGKTLLAYRIAWELLQTGSFRYLVSNGRNVWSNSPSSVVPRPNQAGEPQYLDAVIVLDEGGHIIEGAAHGAAITAFARKLNIVVLIPSVEEPPHNMRVLYMARVFDAGVFGVPFQWWALRLTTRFFRDRYGLGIWRPSSMYGVYDTEDFTQDEDAIEAMLRNVVDERRGDTKRAGRRRRGLAPLGDEGRFAADFSAAAAELSQSLSLLEGFSTKRRRR